MRASGVVSSAHTHSQSAWLSEPSWCTCTTEAGGGAAGGKAGGGDGVFLLCMFTRAPS